MKELACYKLPSNHNAPPRRASFDWEQWGLRSTTGQNSHTSLAAPHSTPSSTGPNTSHLHTQNNRNHQPHPEETTTPKRRKCRKKDFKYYHAATYRQRKLNGQLSALDNHEYYGNNAKVKRKNVSRFVGTNVDRHIHLADSSEKNKDIFRGCKELKADICSNIETGLDWRLMEPENGMYQRTKAAKGPCKASIAHNTTEPPKQKTQWGGTALMCFQTILPRIVDISKDPENLGRWVTGSLCALVHSIFWFH